MSRPATGAGCPTILGLPACWLAALGLVICLTGCQPRENKPPVLPLPPPAQAAPLPRPEHPTLYVTISHLRLRACPGKECPETATLELNAPVEKLGEVENWTQIRVKKNGTIGYVSSRYLAPHPVTAAKPLRKKRKLAKRRKPDQPPAAAVVEKPEPALEPQEPSPPLPKVM